MMGRASSVLACMAFLLHGSTKIPEFQDYVSHDRLDGRAAEPRLTTTWARKYRTRIRRGAASEEGFRRGFEYVETPGPNFAGHYRVVNWGCGSGCLMMVIVDLKTGAIYPPPLSVAPTGEGRIRIPNLGTGWAGFDFRENSRLFVMEICPGGAPDPKSPLYRGKQLCGTSYFLLEPHGFRLIQRVQWDPDPPLE